MFLHNLFILTLPCLRVLVDTVRCSYLAFQELNRFGSTMWFSYFFTCDTNPSPFDSLLFLSLNLELAQGTGCIPVIYCCIHWYTVGNMIYMSKNGTRAWEAELGCIFRVYSLIYKRKEQLYTVVYAKRIHRFFKKKIGL